MPESTSNCLSPLEIQSLDFKTFSNYGMTTGASKQFCYMQDVCYHLSPVGTVAGI